MRDTRPITRRSVLKATGAAAAAAVGGTAPAAAGFTPGTCVVTTTATDLWIEACPTSGNFTTAAEGSEGEVLETCTGAVDDWVQVQWNDYPISWANTDDLTSC